MNAPELRAEAAVEFELLGQVIDELDALRHDVAGREPTMRERVAAGAFLMQFYNGVENLLKRISKHNGVPMPAGQKPLVVLHQTPKLRRPGKTALHHPAPRQQDEAAFGLLQLHHAQSKRAPLGSALRPWAKRSRQRRSWTMSSKTPALIQRWVCWCTAYQGGRSCGIRRQAMPPRTR